jgi:hypothetical protein
LISDELTWDSDHKSNSRNSSIRAQGRIPNLTIDELELYEPKKINTVNEMILECAENEEGEQVKRIYPGSDKLESLIQQRQLVDQMMNKIKDTDELKSSSFRDLLNQNKSHSNKNDIILENQEEYMFGDT